MVPGMERRGFSGFLAPYMVAGAALGCWGAARAGLHQEGGQARSWEGVQRSAAQHRQGKALAAAVKGKALTAIQLA